MGKRRKTIKRGKYTSIDEMSSNIFDDLESEYRLAALLDEAEEAIRQKNIVQEVHPEIKVDALINGTSKTTEQQIARRLVFGDGKLGRKANLPPDKIRGKDLRVYQLGIDGPIKPDSTVYGGTTAQIENDVVTVNRNNILTEYLSPEAEEKLFEQWSKLNPGESRKNFNADVSEYYGQQMLRTVGAQPVSDNDRSEKVRAGIRKDPNKARESLPLSQSTKGTDRLIENSVGLLSPDIDLSGDFRYIMDGKIRVGDHQTGEPRDTIRLNLLKAAYGPGTDTRSLRANWMQQAQRLASVGSTPTASKIIAGLIAQGKLPAIKRGRDGLGVRAGKAMSSDPMFLHQNNESQFRYDDILFAHTDEKLRSQPRGYIPSDVVLVDARKAGDAIGVMPASIYSDRGSVNVTPEIKDLIAAGAAKRLTDDPRIKQLLQ